MLVAFDSLTMYHCATRKFRDQFAKRGRRNFRRGSENFGGVATVYDPETFFRPDTLAQLQLGESG